MELSTEWAKLFGADGQWKYMRLDTYPLLEEGVTPNTPREDGEYPAVEVVEIIFLPEFRGDSEIQDENVYIASRGYFDVQNVSYKEMAMYVNYRGRYRSKSLRKMAGVSQSTPLVNIALSLPMLTDDDKLYFSERLRWLDFTGAEKTPDGKTLGELESLLEAVAEWRLWDACERAEAMSSYGGMDPVGYGRGEFASFADACTEAGIYRADAEDDEEWNYGVDLIPPFGPYCRVCGEQMYPKSVHSTAHWNYLEVKRREAEDAEDKRRAAEGLDLE